MIEPTEEMVRAYIAAQDAAELGGIEDGLAGVLAIVERDRAVVDPDDLRIVLDQRTGHAHAVPGRWDDTGLPCAECAARDRLRAALAACGGDR